MLHSKRCYIWNNKGDVVNNILMKGLLTVTKQFLTCEHGLDFFDMQKIRNHQKTPCINLKNFKCIHNCVRGGLSSFTYFFMIISVRKCVIFLYKDI